MGERLKLLAAPWTVGLACSQHARQCLSQPRSTKARSKVGMRYCGLGSGAGEAHGCGPSVCDGISPPDVSVVAHRLTPVCALHPSAVSPSRALQQLIIALVSVMVKRGEGRHQRACRMPPTCSICVLCVLVYCLLPRACVTTILTSAPTCSPPQRHTYT